MDNAIEVEVIHCARCKQNHKMLFREFREYPIVDADGTTWTHWGLCPNAGEPVLLEKHAAEREIENGEV